MQKIVINTGTGFELTHKAIMRYAELKGIKLTAYIYSFHDNIYVKCEDVASLPTIFQNLDYFINTSDDTIQYGHKTTKYFSIYNIIRTDPALLQVVNELKDSEQLDLKIVEVPDDVKWKIEEDEMGPECVREVSRIWK